MTANQSLTKEINPKKSQPKRLIKPSKKINGKDKGTPNTGVYDLPNNLHIFGEGKPEPIVYQGFLDVPSDHATT